MKLIRFYKRARFFLLINITGLAIGFAVSIMLLLFVVNELSYDKHFAGKDRIVRLSSVFDDYNTVSVNLRSAYTELPSKVPGIDYAVQIFSDGAFDVVVEQNTFKKVNVLFTDPEFFKVFQMQFIDGVPGNALKEPNSVVITRRYADIIFGNASNAMGNQISVRGKTLTVSGIVKELPANTHFTFDMLMNIPEDYVNMLGGCEYNTYYLINKEASLATVRKNIEAEYTSLMKSRFTNEKCGGLTEKLTDVYFSKISSNIAKRSSINRIQILSLIAVLILILAIANFVNLFITHGESRMKEIGIRKANGAGIWDIVRQFLSEVSVIVFIAFVLGFALSVYLTPWFSQLIKVEISLMRLISLDFIICVSLLFIFTVALSAGYPAFYLSRFSPLDILFKRIRFSKRRLTAGVVVFQTIITLVLMSYIFTMNRQTKYLENCDKGYNPENVASILLNRNLYKNYGALRQELMQFPFIRKISGSDHHIGGRCSGQSIASLGENTTHGINEYRVMPDMCELIGLQLVDGDFLKEEDKRDTLRTILINEAAMRMLGLERPIAGKFVNYKGDVNTKVLGVVKDFYYDSPGNEIKPLAISFCFGDIGSVMYFKFDENINRMKIRESLNSVFNKFDPNFFVEPVWTEDIYAKKFEGMKTQSTIILLSTLLSLLVVILGLFAIHLYTIIRRTKEIGIRRIYGADHKAIFMLLSSDILKWIGIAALIAIPVEYYIVSSWLEGYANRVPLTAGIFLFPVLIQCAIALSISFGLTVRTLSQNPVTSLKSE
ncbi:MAG: ABC transporter permease [Prevotellaceae bacterium]|jgi:putative ABC transport system permease protein|nr:ABC transporter permease [Prevotellaceae bacterium]